MYVVDTCSLNKLVLKRKKERKKTKQNKKQKQNQHTKTVEIMRNKSREKNRKEKIESLCCEERGGDLSSAQNYLWELLNVQITP